jgi:hypothetical protein
LAFGRLEKKVAALSTKDARQPDPQETWYRRKRAKTETPS